MNDDIIFNVFMLLAYLGCPLLYIPLQIVTSIYCRGVARRYSLAPIPFAAFVFVITAISFLQEDNLWPICMIILSPVAIAYLCGCLLAECKSRRKLSAKIRSE